MYIQKKSVHISRNFKYKNCRRKLFQIKEGKELEIWTFCKNHQYFENFTLLILKTALIAHQPTFDGREQLFYQLTNGPTTHYDHTYMYTYVYMYMWPLPLLVGVGVSHRYCFIIIVIVALAHLLAQHVYLLCTAQHPLHDCKRPCMCVCVCAHSFNKWQCLLAAMLFEH